MSLPIFVRCFRNLREINKPLALASRPTSIGPDHRRTLAYGSAYEPTARTEKMQLAPPAVSSSSVDEVQPASCCWCRCRPAGVTAETTAVESAAVHQPLLQAYQSAGGTSCGPLVCLLYLCRYARVKLSVPESDRRCSPLACCPRRISVGRAHRYRKHMYSIR